MRPGPGIVPALLMFVHYSGNEDNSEDVKMNNMELLDEKVQEVEKEFIAARQPYTALDVGNELKRRGVNARQRDVSPIVRQHFKDSDIYTDGSYTRTLIDVDDKVPYVKYLEEGLSEEQIFNKFIKYCVSWDVIPVYADRDEEFRYIF